MERPTPTPPYPDLPDDLLQAWILVYAAFGDVLILAVVANPPRPDRWEQSPLDDDGEVPRQ
jgi:hypothetical protein